MVSDPSGHSSSRSGGMVARIRSAMEILALAMIVAVCGFMIAAIARGTWVVTPAPSRVAAAARARPEPPVPEDPVSLDGANVDGPRSAAIAVIEFSDFQCPYCGRFARETWPSIRKSYVETGKVLFAFREFPLESIHKSALQAAEAAECAGEQNSFWKMHDLMFADQTHLEQPALEARAHDSGLDVPRFDKCLASSVDAKVKADEKTGVSLAVAGTPTFFLGRIQADGRVKVVRRFSGTLPAADFGAVLDAMLKGSDGRTATR
jgi:protein-disulfide isomerase